MGISEFYLKKSHYDFLYNIAPIQNICSILADGILSKSLVEKSGIHYYSLADESVQDRRDKIKVPDGLKLHEYANLYFNPRNPMLYKLINERPRECCLLQVDFKILDVPNVVVTDRNAASFAHFMTPVEGLLCIDFKKVYAEYWTDNDPSVYEEKKKAICAEVLVPYTIEPQWIKGILVPDLQLKNTLIKSGIDEKIIKEEKYLFFRKKLC